MAPIQKPQWKLAAFVIALVLAIVYLLFSNDGVLQVRHLRMEKAKLEKKVFDLEQSKKELTQEIDRLKSSPAAMEQIVREQMDMIREDETLFVFPPKKSDGGP